MKTTLSKIALIVLSVISLSAQAANSVDSRYQPSTFITGDNNKVIDTGKSFHPGWYDSPATISLTGYGNTLSHVESSDVFGDNNTITNSDVNLHGQNNQINYTFGNYFGDNNIVTGSGQGNLNVYGSGVHISGEGSGAFGDDIVSTSKNSITLGNKSTNNRDNSVSIGSRGSERQLTNVASGTADTDASNVKQMRDGDTDTYNSARGYTDTAINTEQAARQAGDAATLSSAKGYTDARENVINSRMDNMMAQEKSDRIKGDADTLAKSGNYTDKQTAVTLSKANSYTDAREQAINSRTDGLVADEASKRIAGDAETLKSANTHTDTLVGAEKQARIEGDRKTLKDATGYTDQRETFINNRTDSLLSDERSARIDGDRRTLNSANAYTNQRYDQLDNKVNRNERRANAGIAGAMAMSGIPYLNNYVDNSFGMAAGSYRGETAIASGYQRQINPYVNARVSMTWDTSQGVGVAAGMAVGW